MGEDAKAPDQPAATGPAWAGLGKWMRVALVASLGANIFLGGFIAARMLGPKAPEAEPEIVDLRLRGLPRGLSSEMREELENSLRAYRHEIRSAYGEYRDQQRQINRLLVEDILNEPAIAQAQRELRGLNARIQRQMQRALVDAMREMKAETRRGMIDLRRIPRVRRFGRPESVDGSRWRFSWRDGDGFHLDMHGDHMMVALPSGRVNEGPNAASPEAEDPGAEEDNR